MVERDDVHSGSNDPSAPDTNCGQVDATGGAATRRRLIKAGALLVPTLLTLRARPAWADHEAPDGMCRGKKVGHPDPDCSAYGMSRVV